VAQKHIPKKKSKGKRGVLSNSNDDDDDDDKKQT
jgi:hypothetical protein